MLNSVVDSIKDQPSNIDTNPTTPTSAFPDDQNISPNTRRNRDLAHVLFGTEDDLADDDLRDDTVKMKVNPGPDSSASAISGPQSDAPAATSSMTATIAALSITELASNGEHKAPPMPSPYLLHRNPSAPRIPQTPQEEAALTLEVQQKADAAMVALNKNPSHVNLADGLRHTPSIRRRIDPSQISTPKLVSATTSVQTVPLRSPSLSSNNPGPSKLGSRFRKLRGSLRAKNLVSSGEETVAADISKSPPASQLAHYDPVMLDPPGAPKLSSATEAGRFKVSIPSPPASAGPGLKGFMARFRNKQRISETPPGGHLGGPRATSPLSPVPALSSSVTSPLTPRFVEPTTPKAASSYGDKNHTVTARPAGQPRPMYSRFPPASPPAPLQAPPHAPTETPDGSKSAHLEQLFSAANKLGLDESALSDLLARSGSASSRSLLSKNTTSAAKPTEWNDIQQVSYVGSTSSDQTATPTSYSNPLTDFQSRARPTEMRPITPDDSLSRKPSTRKPDHLRRPREGQNDNANSAIVRRTIIVYANDAVSQADIAALAQSKIHHRGAESAPAPCQLTLFTIASEAVLC